ncbi:MAG TPA: hypothetical protein VGD87_07775, partial [Archangium sp.]
MITLKLHVEDGFVEDACVESTRRTDLGMRLAARHVDEALAMVPRLFSLCGAAHELAARRALSAARSERFDDALHERRCTLEAIDNHGFQLCVEWPRLAGCAPLVEPLRALRRETSTLREDLSGLEAAVEEVAKSRRCLESARALEDHELSFAALPATADASSFADLPMTAAFAAHPELRGPRESGAWSRLPLKRTSLFDRLTAQLEHLELLVEALRHPRPLAPFRRVDGLGVGLAETSRGLVLHRVALEGERVTAWHVVAPTEWTFHP